MHDPDSHRATAHLPLARRWRRLRAAYRLANVASHHLLGFIVKTVLLGYFAFAILFLALRYAILPNIDHYKGDIEALASRALGNQVSIARIYASWRGLRPNLFLGDVVLRDREGRQVLSLPSVSATLSWWSVLAGEARFDSLAIIRPDLDIRRDAAGRLYVAGIALAVEPGDGGGADWAFRQREVVIREGRVHWTDQLRGAPELALENVDMVLLNHWTRHRVALRATPPAALAKPLDIRADFTHPRFAARVADLRLWQGELYADLRDTDLAGWKDYVDYPFQVTRGRGSVRAWLALDHAKLAGFTADVGLADVSARLAPDLPQLDLARVSGRLAAREVYKSGEALGLPTFGAHGHSVTLTNFALTTTDGLSLPATTVSEVFTPGRGGKPDSVDISARLLDLETLAELAAQLPLSGAQRSALEQLEPRGRLRDFSAHWEGRYPAVASYRLRGRLDGLGMRAQPARAAQAGGAAGPALAALPAIPGFRNLSGNIDASDKGGSLLLDSRQLVLQLPAWYADPALPFDVLNMRAHWSFADPRKLQFHVEAMDFVQGRMKGSLTGTHWLPLGPGGGAGVVDLDATLSGFELERIDRYLPLQTPASLRGWLVGALEAGVAQDVSIRLRGELAQFPFRADTAADRARGQFRVAGRLENARLNYAPGRFARDGAAPLWPQAEAINGSFLFDRARMEIKGNTARTLGATLTNVTAVVPDLSAREMMLDIDGTAAAPLQEFLRYMAASPVLDWIGRFTEDSRASGHAKLGLKLHLPLARLADARVNGVLQLAGNDVLLFAGLPTLQSTLGKIEFNERGVNLNGIGASFMGGPLALTGGSMRDNSILIKMSGSVTTEGLRRAFAAPAMQRLAGHLDGGTRFTGSVQVKDRQLAVLVDSNLVGLGLAFPAPANKAASEVLAAHFSLNGAAPAADGAARDELRLTLGNGVGAHYLRQRPPKGGWTVLRGGVGVNVAVPEPDSGLMINVNMKALNVDQWLAIGTQIAGKTEPGGASADAGARDLAQYIEADSLAARTGELIVGERKLDNVVVGASHQKGVWQANIDARQASGYVTWNESAAGLGKVTARLSSLIIPESAEADVKDLLESGKSAVAAIPALDIVAERFELFNKQLGRLELVANNGQAQSGGREWQINRLSLTNPDGQLAGTGKWVTRDGHNSTSLNFGLDIADAGNLLDRFGFPETLRRGKGKLSGEIAWSGLPYRLDIPSLSGQIELNVAAGQFLKQDPGAAKLLGVLSLQALPRLLKLDFHDVFSDGLAFDGITAHAAIARGVIKTENLKMHGVAATVLMDGTADIANETTRLHVVVIPEFNLGTGPLVYALAVNPVIGLGSFLAQLFLRAPVMRALTYEMQVDGPWKAPVITKLAGGKAPSAAVK